MSDILIVNESTLRDGKPVIMFSIYRDGKFECAVSDDAVGEYLAATTTPDDSINFSDKP